MTSRDVAPLSMYSLPMENPHSCGYCSSKENTSISIGVMVNELAASHYETLIRLGWRRCGKYMYLPTMNKTCCPQYPINLDVADFQPSKSHRKTLNRFERFLATGHVKQEATKAHSHAGRSSEDPKERIRRAFGEAVLSVAKNCGLHCEAKIEAEFANSARICQGKKQMGIVASPFFIKGRNLCPGDRFWQTVSGEELCKSFNSSVDIQQEVLAAVSNYIATHMDTKKDAVQSIRLTSGPGGLLVLSVQPQDMETRLKAAFNNSHHHEQNAKAKTVKADAMEVMQHTLDVSMDVARSTDERYQLYKKYQMEIHGDEEDDISELSFKRFLVDSPLTHEQHHYGDLNLERAAERTLPTPKFGTFHQLYRVDGRLVAVGVVDILPTTLSSVYLYYDPEYDYLKLGVWSALQEIKWVQDRIKDGLTVFKNYCMGYYVHNCQKMLYKGQFRGSCLSCPITHEWVPIDDRVRTLLDKKKFACLCGHSSGVLHNSPLTEEEESGDPTVVIDRSIHECGDTELEIFSGRMPWKMAAPLLFQFQVPQEVVLDIATKMLQLRLSVGQEILEESVIVVR